MSDHITSSRIATAVLALERVAAAAERLSNAIESIARAFEPAQDSLDQGPAKPDVSGVKVADD